MNHLVEWHNSCVDEQLTRLNVTALEGSYPSEYLLYADDLPRRNDGRVSENFLKRYEHTEQGGWWCSGIDLLTGEEDLWGCFKPNQPRRSGDKRKVIKYEHPPQAPAGVFALRVPLHIWERIAKRYGLEILPQDVDVNQPDLGFWDWLIAHPPIPLCLTEGAKKAGTLLTAGYAAIALPGINGGYRTPRNEQGKRLGKSRLIPQLQKLAQPGREIYLAFDQDLKPTTIQAVEAAIKKTGYLLVQAGCTVKVITWDSALGKGVDDFIAREGQETFDRAYQKALVLETWKAKSLNRLTYTPDIQVNCPYLPELSIPESAQLVGIKSAKGTGKTQFLETVVTQAIQRQQKVLVIGHRVKLVEELCQRFGMQYITEVDQAKEPRGYGLCIDSLHPNSQAQFQGLDWSDSLVIIDEVEQVLWHGLNSSTCKNNRVPILKSLKILMQEVLGSEGQVMVTDADLSNIALDYLISLSGLPLQPFLIQNNWRPGMEESWQVYNYPESTPKKLVGDLEKYIREGGKPFVCLSAQKLTSQWGTRSLEAYLTQQFPQAKILRLDSESLADPSHPAFGSITNLNSILADYEIVLASPSIETGVSIDLKGHFTAVWAIAQGVQTANSVCQAIGRIRENIPRYLWIAPYGFNKVGNGSTSIPSLLTSGQRLTQLNIRLLQQSDFEALDDLDTGFQAESLLCWARMAVRVNAAMATYRESILVYLQEEGHQVTEASSLLNHEKARDSISIQNPKSKIQNPLAAAITAVREQNYQAECEMIATAPNLSNSQYQTIKKQLVKTTEQRHALRKYDLLQCYGIPVTSALVAKDDGGWYQKLRLHYFLTIGRPYLSERDRMVARKLIEQGQGSLFLPDFNRSQLGAIIGIMEILGIPVLLAYPERKLRNTDKDLQAMTEIAINNRSEIKAAVGIGIAKNASPITIIRRFLDQIGYSLTCLGCGGTRKKRVRIYQIVAPDDGRELVFSYWSTADAKYPGSSELGGDDWLINNISPIQPDRTNEAKYIQLSLNFDKSPSVLG